MTSKQVGGVILSAALILSLAGCAGSRLGPSSRDENRPPSGEISSEEDLSGTQQSRMAQTVAAFRAADTPGQRGFLGCALVLATTEGYIVAVEQGRIEMVVAFAQVSELQGVVNRILEVGVEIDETSGDWAHSQRARVIREFAPYVKRLGKSHFLTFAGAFATFDWTTIIKQLETIGFTAHAVGNSLRDSLALLEKVQADERTEDSVTDSCTARIDTLKRTDLT